MDFELKKAAPIIAGSLNVPDRFSAHRKTMENIEKTHAKREKKDRKARNNTNNANNANIKKGYIGKGFDDLDDDVVGDVDGGVDDVIDGGVDGIGEIAIGTPQLLTIKTDKDFWKVIARIGWHSTADGFNKKSSTDILFSLSDEDQEKFGEIYNRILNETIDLFDEMGFFVSHAIANKFEKVAIVSHIIGLGFDAFNAMKSEIEFLSYTVDSKEYQNFDEYLPNNIAFM